MRLSFGKNPPSSFSNVVRSGAALLRTEVDDPVPAEPVAPLRPSVRRERTRGGSVLSTSTQTGEVDLTICSDSRRDLEGRVRYLGEDGWTDLLFSGVFVEEVFSSASVEGVCMGDVGGKGRSA